MKKCGRCGANVKAGDPGVTYSPWTRSWYCPVTRDAACVKRAAKNKKAAA